MKYLYQVVASGTVEADTPAEAEALALWEVDNGLEQVRGVEVEPLKGDGEEWQALQSIATSGDNNAVIYLPTNPNTGLPVVPTSNLPTVAKK